MGTRSNNELMAMIDNYWSSLGYTPPKMTLVRVFLKNHKMRGEDLRGIRSDMINGMPRGGRRAGWESN